MTERVACWSVSCGVLPAMPAVPKPKAQAMAVRVAVVGVIAAGAAEPWMLRSL
jgi:hypothetical protein